ncbi:MAG: hypothetical protein U0586_08335 [Candidatus Brocadiaceae bacterium]
MTLTMHFDGIQHVVIASVCSDDFSRLRSLRAGEAIFPLFFIVRSSPNQFAKACIFFKENTVYQRTHSLDKFVHV